MSFDLRIFGDPAGSGSSSPNPAQTDLNEEYIDWLIDVHWPDNQTHFGKLWQYYANPMYEIAGIGAYDRKVGETGRCYAQAQETGLPTRITGLVQPVGGDILSAKAVKDVQRKEVVIENDIAWRINAGVDFLFGKPVDFISKSADNQKRAEIEAILKAVFAANGAIGFFQDMAVLGSVYGFIDCLVRPGEQLVYHAINPSSKAFNFEYVLQLAQTIALELIEAPRALPVLDENDYKKTKFYIQHFHQKKNELVGKSSFLSRFLPWGDTTDTRQVVAVTEIISDSAWQRYEDRKLLTQGELPWGFMPVVHIQNIAQPYYYEGQSDVEPLIPLQDELNTRLSDRANRITFQSFKMYLGKGIEGFEDRPVSPGRMWYTDNPDATIEEFGGEAEVPSENMHIAEIREAIDKVSGVTPVVAGVLKDKLGNLTSAVAIRLTLMGMLSKNERKRFTYSEGLKKICRMILAMLDRSGIYVTDRADRDFDIIFPSPMPENMTEKLNEAKIKRELGVPAEQVLRELGYEN